MGPTQDDSVSSGSTALKARTPGVADHQGPLWASLVIYVVKNSLANAVNSGSVLSSERSPGRGKGNLLQYTCLGNPMDKGAWWATVYRVAESQIKLSNSTTTKMLGMEPRGIEALKVHFGRGLIL